MSNISTRNTFLCEVFLCLFSVFLSLLRYGIVKKQVYVAEGAVVKKGEKLMAFDVLEAKQNLSDAKVSLSNAKEKNSISESDASRSVSYV